MAKRKCFKNLREFIKYLEDKGDLVRIKEEVDPVLEINAIICRLVREDGPAVIFENVKGHNMPVLGNLFGSYRRLSDALLTDDYSRFIEEIDQKMSAALTSERKERIFSIKAKGIIAKLDILKKLPDFLIDLFEAIKIVDPLIPVRIQRRKAKCKEVILTGDQIDLNKLPLVQLWPKDGGKYITLPLIITRDPESRELNVGIYRMMQIDKDKICMHWLPQKHGNMHHKKYEAMNKEMPVVVVIGAEPVIELAGSFVVPPPLDEFIITGMLRDKASEYVLAEDSDLWVPASAEIVLEGVIKPHERHVEGPFGEFHGYYSPQKDTPVFHVKKITMRKNPIFHVATTGMPPSEIHIFAKAAERLGALGLKRLYPGVVDINMTKESGCVYTFIVSFKKSRPYEVQDFIQFLWSFNSQSAYITTVIVVDSEIDVQNLSKVFWAMSVHFRPEQDLIITPVAMVDLEKPGTFPRGVGARMGIDATTKTKEEGLVRGMPDPVFMDKEVADKVEKQWKEYGF